MVDQVAVAIVLLWRWRCEKDGAVFPGSDLRMKLDGGGLIPLEECQQAEIERYTLRHKCGSKQVVPVAPRRSEHRQGGKDR